jgi:hypothetical protein
MTNFTESQVTQILNYLDETVNEYYSHHRDLNYVCNLNVNSDQYQYDTQQLSNTISSHFDNKYVVNCKYATSYQTSYQTDYVCVKTNLIQIELYIPRKYYAIDLTNKD